MSERDALNTEFSYKDPTEAFSHILHIAPTDSTDYHGDATPVVAVRIEIPEDATDQENPLVYVPLADVQRVVNAVLAAAGQAPASPCTCAGVGWGDQSCQVHYGQAAPRPETVTDVEGRPCPSHLRSLGLGTAWRLATRGASAELDAE